MFRLKGDNIMKKLIAVACAALLLAGCGSSSEPKEVKKESKTCSTTVSGMKADMKMNAEDDIIKTIDMSYVMPSTLLGTDASKLSEDDMKEMADSMMAQFGAEEGQGITVKAEAAGKDLQVVMSIDLATADKTVLKALSFEGNTKNIKLSDSVKDAEKGGMTCK